MTLPEHHSQLAKIVSIEQKVQVFQSSLPRSAPLGGCFHRCPIKFCRVTARVRQVVRPHGTRSVQGKEGSIAPLCGIYTDLIASC